MDEFVQYERIERRYEALRAKAASRLRDTPITREESDRLTSLSNKVKITYASIAKRLTEASESQYGF